MRDIGANEVISAAIEALKETYTGHRFYSEKIQQGFKRPCFFLSASESESALLDERVERVIELSVVYFSEKQNEDREKSQEVGIKLSAMLEWLQFGIGYKRANDITIGFDKKENLVFGAKYITHVFKKRPLEKMMKIKHDVAPKKN